MNYNHLNESYEYWKTKIFPYLSQRYNCVSFEKYLRDFSYLPSGKWMRDMGTIKLFRSNFAINPEKMVEQYKNNCVSYICPARVDEGVQRIIYQISPTLHFEATIWIWLEHNAVNSYASTIVCFDKEKEYNKFMDDLWEIRREGNTEEKPRQPGFIGNINLFGNQEVAKEK